MMMRRNRRPGLFAGPAALFAIALWLGACSNENPDGDSTSGDESPTLPSGLTAAGGGSQPGGQSTGSSTTASGGSTGTGAGSQAGGQSAGSATASPGGSTAAGSQPGQPTLPTDEQALAQLMGQMGAALGGASGSPTGAGPTGMTGATGQQSGASAGGAVGGDCCSCAITSRRTLDDPRLPCQFDIPGDWQAGVSGRSGMLSAMAGRQACDTVCPSGTPSMTVAYGTMADANAATMQGIWKQGMRKIGTARCGEGEVTFYAPPVGADEREKMGGIKFYVNIDGNGYGGTAMFSCGEPGGWMRYRDLFVESFGDNPDSTFPK